jgi:hypothetical protein
VLDALFTRDWNPRGGLAQLTTLALDPYTLLVRQAAIGMFWKSTSIALPSHVIIKTNYNIQNWVRVFW